MRSTILKKAVTISVCIAFLLLVVPGAVNAEKRVIRSDVRSQISKSTIRLSSLFPFFAALLRIGMPGEYGNRFEMPKKDTYNPALSARPTGDIIPPKPSDGD